MTKVKQINDVNDTSKSKEELCTYAEVQDTPFTVAKVTDDKRTEFHVLMGNYRISETPFNNEIDAKTYAEKISWDKIMKVIFIINETQKK